MTIKTAAITLERSVEKLLKTGRFQSRDDILREGVRLIEAEDEHWVQLDAVLIARADDPNSNDFTDGEAVFSRLTAKYRAMLPSQ